MTGYDPVFEPEHYKALGAECPNCGFSLEPILFTKLLNFCLGNVVKYVLRADHKGKALEDLSKARNYLDIEIDYRKAVQSPRAVVNGTAYRFTPLSEVDR